MRVSLKFIFSLLLLITLLFTSCDLFKKYEIQGTWVITKKIEGNETTFTAKFMGLKSSGDVEVSKWIVGVYRVNYDTDIFFNLLYFNVGSTVTNNIENYFGEFDDKDTMKGTLEVLAGGIKSQGEWTAVRTSDS
jgi:hypothetical protein